jgi:hypothetical protein
MPMGALISPFWVEVHGNAIALRLGVWLMAAMTLSRARL